MQASLLRRTLLSGLAGVAGSALYQQISADYEKKPSTVLYNALRDSSAFVSSKTREDGLSSMRSAWSSMAARRESSANDVDQRVSKQAARESEESRASLAPGPNAAPDRDSFIDALKSSLGDEIVSDDPDTLEEYGQDWSQRFAPNARVVVFPNSIEQVCQAVSLANEHDVVIVPSGGRTGLSAGATATKQEMVISLQEMNNITQFNPKERTVYCEAGVTTHELQAFAKERGLYYPVDFASKYTSQIGGNISTNARGVKALRWGPTSDWVAGLLVVTPQGKLLNLNNCLVNDATGFDLKRLYMGTEGSMGIIVGATMKLTQPPTSRTVSLLAIDSPQQISEIKAELMKRFDISSLELFSRNALVYNPPSDDLRQALGSLTEIAPYYLLVECINNDLQQDKKLKAMLASFSRDHLCQATTIAEGENQADQFWGLREGISGSLTEHKPYKYDVSVRPGEIDRFIAVLEDHLIQAFPMVEFVWFGHIGDGSIHINLIPPKVTDSEAVDQSVLPNLEEINHAVFELVQSFGGSVSAEHGLGRSKQPYQPYSRSSDEIGLMRQIKRAVDPEARLQRDAVYYRSSDP